MNNDALTQTLPGSAEALLGVIAPLLDSVCKALHAGMLPADGEVLQLRAALQAYTAAAEREAAQAARYGELVFENCTDTYVPDADLIENQAMIPDMSRVMLRLAVKKLVPFQDRVISEQTLQQLIQAGYAAPISLHTQQGTERCCTLTSKGLLWFDRKKLSLKLRKDERFRALPAALQINPDTWNAETAYQAFTLRRYYTRTDAEYLLFPSPHDAGILLGCEAAAAGELRYCLAWTDGFMQSAPLRAYLTELLSAEAELHITIVCAAEAQQAEAMRLVRELQAEGRIELFYLEEHGK